MTIQVVYTGTRPPDTNPDSLTVRHWPLLETTFCDIDAEALLSTVRATSTTVTVYSKNAVRAIQRWTWRDQFINQVTGWWAVGPKTAHFATEQLDIDCRSPSAATFDGLVDALRGTELPDQLVSLSVRGKTRDLDRAIGDRDVDWRDVSVYETGPAPWHERRRTFLEQEADWVALTSPRGVRAMLDQFDRDGLDELRFAAIGPTTARAMTDRQLSVDAVPDDPGRDNLLHAIVDAGFNDA